MELPRLSNPTQLSRYLQLQRPESPVLKAHPAQARSVLGAKEGRLTEPPQLQKSSHHVCQNKARLQAPILGCASPAVHQEEAGQWPSLQGCGWGARRCCRPGHPASSRSGRPRRTGCARCAPPCRPPPGCPAHGTSSPPAPSAGSPAGTIPKDIGCARSARPVFMGLTCLWH